MASGGGRWREARIAPFDMASLETVELRWFLHADDPRSKGLARAFVGLEPEPPRTDFYLRTGLADLGIKARGEGDERPLEIKLRRGQLGPVVVGRASGMLESWSKVALEAAGPTRSEDAEWREVRKRRRERALVVEASGVRDAHDGEEPSRRCTVELTHLELSDGSAWDTFGFEASGPSGTALETLLRAAHWLFEKRQAGPSLDADASRGYPSWLRDLDARR